MADNQKINSVIEHVERSITAGLNKNHNMDSGILGITGFSTPEFRCFLNNLCSTPNSKYLEIGTWMGGTSCAAIANNNSLTAYFIDNFSEYNPDGGVKKILIHNLTLASKTDPSKVIYDNDYVNINNNITFYDSDSFKFDPSRIDKKISYYFYDGGHSSEQQRMALTHYIDLMDDVFVFIVDDYNWPGVQIGTKQGLEDIIEDWIIEKEWAFITPANMSPVWHNGCYIAVISRREK